MQIHDNKLMAECSSCDLKETLERKKVKSWLHPIEHDASWAIGRRL